MLKTSMKLTDAKPSTKVNCESTPELRIVKNLAFVSMTVDNNADFEKSLDEITGMNIVECDSRPVSALFIDNPYGANKTTSKRKSAVLSYHLILEILTQRRLHPRVP